MQRRIHIGEPSTLDTVFGASILPVRDGNTSGDPSDSLRVLSSTSNVPAPSGTVNWRPVFIVDAGIVHLAASMSISSQRAPRASPGRTAVSAQAVRRRSDHLVL